MTLAGFCVSLWAMKSMRLTSLFLVALLAGPVGCGSMQARRSVRAAGYPVEKTSVERRMGAKVVYVYIGRAISDQEREDIKTRVMGAVPTATEIVVYPLPSAPGGVMAVPAGTSRPVDPNAQPAQPAQPVQPAQDPSNARPANPQ